MKSKLFILVCILISVFNASAQRKRAFIVGISDYEQMHNGWLDIHGAEDAQIIKGVLAKQHFDVLSVNPKKATYNTIIASLKGFIKQTKKGDILYLHFSMHGQPIKDEDGDEPDGWDEAIIPLDASMFYKKGVYEGNKHITDDELSSYFSQLRKKVGPTGMVYVTIDACHAGTMSREEDEDPVRGTNSGFSRDGAHYHPTTLEKKNRYKINSSKDLSGIVIMEACRPYQRNTEIKVNGNYYGPLSYYISVALNRIQLTTDPKDYVSAVSAGMKTVQGQDMVVESTQE